MESNKNRVQLSIDMRVIIAVLLILIVAMVAVWRPWSASTSDRTVDVTGEAKISAEADEFVFYPRYQFVNADKSAALAEQSKKSEAIIAELKKLGVEDSKIKTNSGGYDYQFYERTTEKEITYSLQLTVTVATKELAQKVQDYLITTTPTGSVTPNPTFSDAKRKELETRARDEATKQARAKADQSAKNLGFKVSTVKSVKDGAGFGEVMPFATRAMDVSAAAPSSLSVQPGTNDLSYSVTVTYYIK